MRRAWAAGHEVGLLGAEAGHQFVQQRRLATTAAQGSVEVDGRDGSLGRMYRMCLWRLGLRGAGLRQIAGRKRIRRVGPAARMLHDQGHHVGGVKGLGQVAHHARFGAAFTLFGHGVGC
jgi:hypothetical protein